MALPSVLVVDEDPHVLHMFERVLGGSCELTLARGPREALEMVLGSERFDVVVADLNVPETRFELLRVIERCSPEAEVVEMEGRPLGARNADSGYRHPRLAKPLEPVLAERTVKRAIERRGLRAEIEQLRKELEVAGIGRGE